MSADVIHKPLSEMNLEELRVLLTKLTDLKTEKNNELRKIEETLSEVVVLKNLKEKEEKGESTNPEEIWRLS